MATRSKDKYFRERLVELERALDGWLNTTGANTDSEFSASARMTIGRMARIFYLKNPLINRGTRVKADYVYGRGLTIQAKDPVINEVVQAWIDDDTNQNELTGAIAAVQKEIDLQVDGNVVLLLFVHPVTGHVRLSSLPADEITNIITNPDNAKQPWYYLREYTALVTDFATGRDKTETRRTYYRHWRYRDTTRTAIGNVAIDEHALIYHIKVGGFSDWLFGVSELYSALDWAKAYKEFLEDFATIVKALSRFAWRKTVKGGARAVANAKTRLQTGVSSTSSGDSNPPPSTGSVVIEDIDSGGTLEPIRTANSTTPAEDGRRLLLMVAAAMGVPETFFGDVSVGTLATATSLDRPTELMFTNRQKLWVTVYRHLLSFVIYNAVAAPDGPLSSIATIEENEYDEPVVVYDEGINPTIDIDFPSLTERDTAAYVNAIVSAATLDGKQPTIIHSPKMLAKMLLTALGEDDVDSMLDELYPDGTGASIDPDAVITVQTEALQQMRTLLEGLHDRLTN